MSPVKILINVYNWVEKYKTYIMGYGLAILLVGFEFCKVMHADGESVRHPLESVRPSSPKELKTNGITWVNPDTAVLIKNGGTALGKVMNKKLDVVDDKQDYQIRLLNGMANQDKKMDYLISSAKEEHDGRIEEHNARVLETSQHAKERAYDDKRYAAAIAIINDLRQTVKNNEVQRRADNNIKLGTEDTGRFTVPILCITTIIIVLIFKRKAKKEYTQQEDHGVYTLAR